MMVVVVVFSLLSCSSPRFSLIQNLVVVGLLFPPPNSMVIPKLKSKKGSLVRDTIIEIVIVRLLK